MLLIYPEIVFTTTLAQIGLTASFFVSTDHQEVFRLNLPHDSNSLREIESARIDRGIETILSLI